MRQVRNSIGMYTGTAVLGGPGGLGGSGLLGGNGGNGGASHVV